jgi:hypothetical protein
MSENSKSYADIIEKIKNLYDVSIDLIHNDKNMSERQKFLLDILITDNLEKIASSGYDINIQKLLSSNNDDIIYINNNILDVELKNNILKNYETINELLLLIKK